MSFVAVAILGSAAIGAGASIYGATQQSAALGQAQQTLQQGQSSALDQIRKFLAPYANAGADVLPTLKSLLTPGPNQTSTLSQLPGFQFMQDWGQKGVTAQATTRGLGGNALAAGAQFGVGTAQNAWTSLADQLQKLVGTGASAAGTGGTASAQTIGSFAPAMAQTQVGQGNVAAGAAQGVSGSLNNALLLGALTGNFKGMFNNNQRVAPEDMGGP